MILTSLIIITDGCQAQPVGDGDSVGGIGGVTNQEMLARNRIYREIGRTPRSVRR